MQPEILSAQLIRQRVARSDRPLVLARAVSANTLKPTDVPARGDDLIRVQCWRCDHRCDAGSCRRPHRQLSHDQLRGAVARRHRRRASCSEFFGVIGDTITSFSGPMVALDRRKLGGRCWALEGVVSRPNIDQSLISSLGQEAHRCTLANGQARSSFVSPCDRWRSAPVSARHQYTPPTTDGPALKWSRVRIPAPNRLNG